MMLNKLLIKYCAPTLAGIKTANLFSYPFLSKKKLLKDLAKLNKILNPKGLFARILRTKENFALLFVYRLSRLVSDLFREGVGEFLLQYGYHSISANECILRLKERLSHTDEFPHEVGIFLGYPLCDVIGFIDNHGQNCLCTGCWKVYSDEFGAQKLFTQYKKCSEAYRKLFYQGRPIERLIVAA